MNLFDHLRLLDGDRVIEKDDCPAFDPDYDTLPLEVFEPMVMRLFEKPRESVYKAAIDWTRKQHLERMQWLQCWK